jgi:N-methylhydantoinase B
MRLSKSNKEREMTKHNVDPITLEILRNRLESIANTMQFTLLRSAVSVIVKEGEDASSGLFKRNGETITQAVASPIHLTAMRPAVQAVTSTYSIDQMKEKDTYILNDPYNGGTHLPDIFMVAPVFHNDQVIAFCVTLIHHEDVGGQEQGSMSANSKELYQEGLIIPPVPWMKEGKPVKGTHDILHFNVRLPEILFGDLEAQYAGCQIGVRSYKEMIEEFGIEIIESAVNLLFDQAERQIRDELEKIPDGVYEFSDWVDSHRRDRDRPLAKCKIIVKGSEVTADFTGTAPQYDGPINVNLSGTKSGVYSIIKGFTDPNVPLNEGATRAIKVHVPEGCLFNPKRPAPIALRAQISQRAYDVVHGALVSAVGEKAVACPSGANTVTSFGGTRKNGELFGSTDLTQGGTGARSDSDGIDHIEHSMGNCQTPPVEAWEAGYPVRLIENELRMDSGGAGKFRGGLGVRRSFEIINGPIRSCHRHDRFTSFPWGIYGGKAGASTRSYIKRANDQTYEVWAKEVLDLETGDIFVIETGGGGGYGDPLERDPQRVLADVLDRKVSLHAARDDYGVVLDGNSIDDKATKALRAKMIEKRGPITWTYDRGSDGRS